MSDAMTHVRGRIDSNPPEPGWSLIAALLAPIKLVQRVLRRRRERKEYRAWLEFVTRQGRMDPLHKLPPCGKLLVGGSHEKTNREHPAA